MHALEITLNDGFSRDAFEKAAAFIQVAQMSGLVSVMHSSAEVAKDLGADGVILNDATKLNEARTIMGDDAIIGLQCGHNLDQLDNALQSGVDYITLGDASKACDPALVQRSLLTQPDLICAALGAINQDTAPAYIHAGASFLDATHYVLAHPKGAMQGVINMLHEISMATALDKSKVN